MDYNIDSEEVKKYFEFNAVTEGLFTIYQKLFNISFKEIVIIQSIIVIYL